MAESLYQDVTLLRRLRDVPFSGAAGGVTAETQFYRVPFEEAFDLVRERRVLLQGGFAFISRANLVHIVVNRYRTALSQQLAATFRFLQSAASPSASDERIAPLLSSLAKQSLGPQYKTVAVAGQVTREQLPALAASPSFPLCMSSLYSHLKRDHHLKHGGRMQLGLYLKDIGLSLQEALSFWRAAFSRRTPPDRFEKEYSYNIRHNYGKEGKRTVYTAYGCMKIIQSQPAAGDHHGCPFRHDDARSVREMVVARGVSKDGVEEVMRLVKSGDYQVACTRLFALTHGGVEPLMPVHHPNQYFNESRKIAAGGGAAAAAAAKQEVSQTQPVPGRWGGGAEGAAAAGEEQKGEGAAGDGDGHMQVSVSQPVGLAAGAVEAEVEMEAANGSADNAAASAETSEVAMVD